MEQFKRFRQASTRFFSHPLVNEPLELSIHVVGVSGLLAFGFVLGALMAADPETVAKTVLALPPPYRHVIGLHAGVGVMWAITYFMVRVSVASRRLYDYWWLQRRFDKAKAKYEAIRAMRDPDAQ